MFYHPSETTNVEILGMTLGSYHTALARFHKLHLSMKMFFTLLFQNFYVVLFNEVLAVLLLLLLKRNQSVKQSSDFPSPFVFHEKHILLMHIWLIIAFLKDNWTTDSDSNNEHAERGLEKTRNMMVID